jgi:hypothetical protein
MEEIIKTVNGYNVIEYNFKNIYIIENILEDKFCEEIVNFIDIMPKQQKKYEPGNNVECYISSIDNLLKLSVHDDNDDLFYRFSTDNVEYNKLIEKIDNNLDLTTNYLNGMKKKDVLKLQNELNNTMRKIKLIMNEINSKIKLNANTGYDLRKIYGKTRYHIDNISEIMNSNITFIKQGKIDEYRMVRNSSIIFTLNDDYDGGEFIFPYQQVSIKLKKGSVILFPPYWTHPHETNPLLHGTFRYTITTWSCEKI